MYYIYYTKNHIINVPIFDYVLNNHMIRASYSHVYTQTKVKQHHIFFADTVLEVAARNTWVMEIKYLEFYCIFYYFYEHFELKMILSTKYLDNLRLFSKQVKNDKEKQWKKFEADVWKIFFGLNFNRMESYDPEHLLVYYKFLKNLFLLRTESTSGIRLMQDPPFYCKWFLSIDNSVRRLLLLKIVLHYLFADAIDVLRPNLAYADPFWWISGWSICPKKTLFSFRAE